MPSSDKLFAKHRNRVFVETGTAYCKGIDAALAAGFQEVWSIELDPTMAQQAANQFARDPRVKIVCGPSEVALPMVLAQITEPATIFLDAHYSGEGTAKGEVLCPILQELEAIKRHPIRTHTILIDDRRLFGTEEFQGIQEDEAVTRLYEINPKYVVYYDYGSTSDLQFLDDVIVAKAPRI